MVSQPHRQSRVRDDQERGMRRNESRESVNGCQRSGYRQVVGVVNEAKREVLNMCVVVWSKGTLRGTSLMAELKMAGFHGYSVMRIAGVTFLLMFLNEADRRAVLDRSDLD
ncbi:hypothetical protein V6N13_042511 [Hibiscus sabdariffa]